MLDDDLVRFHVDALQYGDFKSSIRAILGTETPEPDTPIEAQLVMYWQELDPGSRGSGSSNAKGFLREVDPAGPRYLIQGQIKEHERYRTESEEGSREVIESLVDAEIPIIVLADPGDDGIEQLVSGTTFDAVGNLHGELAWHDGKVFRPLRGLLQEVRELPLLGSPYASDAIVSLRVNPACKPFKKVTWLRPELD